MQELRAAARDLAALGADVALAHYRRDVDVHRKADGTWVTEADKAVEAEVRREIAARFPGHNVLGEEEGLTHAAGGEAMPGAPTWIVDPIDGTNNFMAGIPIWATLVGLQMDEDVVAGAVAAPALGESYDAATGTGAWMNGEPIAVDDVTSLDEATVLFAAAEAFPRYGLAPFFDAYTRRSFRSRGLGDFWGHVLVARGSAHVMVEPELSRWDVAALLPIVTEAGGRITHLDGRPWSVHGSCVTTNGYLHEQVVAIVSETCPGWADPAGVQSLRRPGD